MPVGVFPRNVDSWSESLIPPEGGWTAYWRDSGGGGGYVDNTTTLDFVQKQQGGACIKTHTEGGMVGSPQYSSSQFFLNNPFDGSRNNCKLVFALDLKGDCVGPLTILLFDTSERQAYIQITNLPHEAWIAPIAPIFQQGWTAQDGFDWSQIKHFSIIAQMIVHIYSQGSHTSGDTLIDYPHFEWEDIPTPFTINAQTISGANAYQKSAVLTTPDNATTNIVVPYFVRLPTLGQWSVRIVSSDFVRWSDGDPSSSKTFTAAGSDIILTAIFQASGGNGGGKDYTWLIVALAGLGAVAVIFELWKRKRRRD